MVLYRQHLPVKTTPIEFIRSLLIFLLFIPVLIRGILLRLEPLEDSLDLSWLLLLELLHLSRFFVQLIFQFQLVLVVLVLLLAE